MPDLDWERDKEARHLNFLTSFQTPGWELHMWLATGSLETTTWHKTRWPYKRPILEPGNVTVLADLCRTHWGSSNYHLLSAFCATQSHSLPTTGAWAYIISNMVGASQTSSSAKPAKDSYQINPHIQRVVDYSWHLLVWIDTNCFPNFFQKILFWISCASFCFVACPSSSQGCCITVGLAYANVLAPQQHLHDPQKTLLSVSVICKDCLRKCHFFKNSQHRSHAFQNLLHWYTITI